jgi:hypothetical protein
MLPDVKLLLPWAKTNIIPFPFHLISFIMKPLIAICLLGLVACNSSGDKKGTDADTTDRSSTNTTAGITAVNVPADQVPSRLNFRGTVDGAWQWKDKLGDNLLITTVVEPFAANTSGEEAKTAELHAFHYIKQDTSYKLLWKISDAEKECPFDISVEFINDPVIVTDIDGDGIGETTIQYKLACRSDVSPAYMKIIMHEDAAKYSLRGLMWIKAGEEDQFTVTENDMNLEKQPKKTDEYEALIQRFGRYETEKEFAAAPAGFLVHARARWMKFVKESFE